MPRISTAFVIDDIAPTDDMFWHAAGEGVHRDFWRVVVDEAKTAKVRELAEGRDRFGRKLVPITRYTRAHRKSAMGEANYASPPLTPADGASRTAAWFDGRAHKDKAVFFWRNGWGRVLDYHRRGARNHWAKSGKLPVRDVIGLSPKQRRVVKQKALAWWSQYRRHAANVEKLKQPPPPVIRSPLPKPRKKPAPPPVPQPSTPRPRLVVERHRPEAEPVHPLPPVPPPLKLSDLHELAFGTKIPRRNVMVAGPAEVVPTPAPTPRPGRLARVGAFFRGVIKRIIGREGP